MGSRILVVEDDPAFSRVLAIGLRARGYQVDEVDNGQDAIEAATRRPCMVLVDLGVSGVDGIEVVRRLRGEPGVFPIIGNSASHDHEMADRVLAEGADAFLTKPFSLGQLLERMRAVTARVGAAAG